MSDAYRVERGDIGQHQPGCLYLEKFAENGNGTTPVTPTLGTDTDIVGSALWMYPVTKDTSEAAICVEALGASPQFEGESAKSHNVYIIGGRQEYSGSGELPRVFRLPNLGRPPRGKTNEIIFEFKRFTLSGGSKTITYSSDLSFINYAFWVIPTEIVSAAPASTGCGVSEITTIEATIQGDTTATIEVLVGGYMQGHTVVESSTVHGGSIPARLPTGIRGASKSDLIGEVVTVTLDGESPSTGTITAADDCEIIQHIQHVIPVSAHTSAQAVGWSGTAGATTTIYSANAASNDVTCLVFGRAY